MAALFVIAGHGAGDPGACANGFQEAERVRALARRVKELGGDGVMLGDESRNYYADGGISSLGLPRGTQLLELHMDSAGGGARGGHVIINGNYSADAYDEALAAMIAGILPGRSRSLVGRTDLANPARAAAAGYGYRLMECGFITSAADVGIFNDRMDDIAAGILAAFGIDAEGWSDMATKEEIAEAVWGHDINGHGAGERLYLCNKMDYDKSDPTGRGVELTTHDHVKHIAKAVAELSEAVAALSAKVGALGAGEPGEEAPL